MKKIKQRYPRRGEMLKTPFEPLPEDEFLKLVASGLAIPGQSGTGLFVAKWRDGPGMDTKAFLSALQAQGSRLEVRKFKGDVNIRVIRGKAPVAKRKRSPAPSRTDPV